MVNGQLWDLTRPLPDQVGEISVLTVDDPKAAEVFAHSSAHVLGAALESMYGDRLLLCDGPALYVCARENPAVRFLRAAPRNQGEQRLLLRVLLAAVERHSCTAYSHRRAPEQDQLAGAGNRLKAPEI